MNAYNKMPTVALDPRRFECVAGWDAVAVTLDAALAAQPGPRRVLAVDCYQGVFEDALARELQSRLSPVLTLRSQDAFQSEDRIRTMVAGYLTDDPVFGRLTDLEIEDYFDASAIAALRARIESADDGIVLLVGPGARLILPEATAVYADMARWEIQQRMRRCEVDNLGVRNRTDAFARKYKWGYFIDWRVLDRYKTRDADSFAFVLDADDPEDPKLLDANAYREALDEVVRRPFMVAPFFDPGPWGGQWLKDVCDLDPSAPNYAWCFNCVPEENSLLLDCDGTVFETPAINLVQRLSEALLGRSVLARFGAEFPIRFDFLDTMGGGNLSLQVHPTTDYIREHFGLAYTQDESYYLMDAKPGARVYLGLREGVTEKEFRAALENAQEGEGALEADRFAGNYPVGKHDHVSIPAGTVHCSGAETMVLEISATPYLFTFKLWDWGRVGLDGEPRPIHIDHGMNVIDFDRTETWVRRELLSRVELVGKGDGWREERTGLHPLEFIETRRHWFTKDVDHDTRGTVNVLCLVEGDEVVVESPSGAFEAMTVHYAETFIVPACVGRYRIRPSGAAPGARCATIKAYVRDPSQKMAR